MSIAPAVDLGAISENLKQLQAKVEQFNKIQKPPQEVEASSAQTPPPATYPKVFRSDTVEDILNNPQWEKELAYEFNESEMGQRAKSNTKLLFLEFCEKQTGKNSTTLADLRKSQQKQTSSKKSDAKDTEPKAVG